MRNVTQMGGNPDFADLPKLNEDPKWYNLIEAALCIWEHIIESVPRGRRDEDNELYTWITQGQGAYTGREMAAQLARLVEIAYRVGDKEGGDYMLDGVAYDWELIPYVIDTWAEQFSGPNDITEADAIAMGKTLPRKIGRQQNDDTE